MLIENQGRNKVKRAVSEIRCSLPILIYDESDYLLFAAAETLERDLFDQYKVISNNLYITLTSDKMQYILKNGKSDNKRLPVNNFDELLSLVNCSIEDYTERLQCSKTIDEYAIALLKFSELLPYALVVDMTFKDENEMRYWCEKNDVIALDTSLVNHFQQDYGVYEVCRTSLFLKQARKVNIVSYRTRSCGKEHYAIIIGSPGEEGEPLVRIHSSCYTGDLLDSLSCDCGSQLHQAIQVISDSGGGIILYLMQDGRGIGLANKLRAYGVQRKYNLDTVDANRVLGFKDDERNFTIAAKILEKLDIKKIQLLTNNDRKLLGLRSSGIEVTKCLPLIMERNEHNDSYMETKFSKLGHKLRIF
ncbi:GTP cyclohydrolase II [Wolbachia endosymbiont of Dirofilaria (Dirofilaria) immitis]|uniref:GTP cyclohydrolase II n=1 Tax=Wolbachia endosymbiont of Dirofilaria immitis TaxID=82301 RepID=A4V6P6_9RICK|nr:GTP cyclohydrolase II [Wolbachia endosymbiont of Dirofilaria (Dirofilaria) immitis]QKX02382.1 GTP cyclohydrolase II RibA [Wolbachia endosymbiont of Dirofilaria (Dirofilaria) immitis]CAJ41431.1 GTP cyclohydrolase II [Wolbachia endosymbiont of Dirofilaria immitis]